MFNELNPLSTVKSILSLKKASKAAVDIFHKACADLERINKNITTEVVRRNKSIESLQKEVSELTVQQDNNTQVIKKIETIIK